MNKPTQPSAPANGGKGPSAQSAERIGEILRRARESRGLSIETLSKELKLNPRYIQALEANDYDLLPGDTYIRVYLRSVCVYLALNPDEILKRFFDERGLTGVDTLRKDSSTKIDLMTVREKGKPALILYIVLALIAVVVAFAFIANSRGWLSFQSVDADVDDQTQQTAPAVDTASETPALPPEVIPRTSKKSAISPVRPVADIKKIKDKIAKTAAARHSFKDTTQKAKKRLLAAAVKDTLSPKAATVKKAQDSLAKVALRKPAADSSRVKAAIAQQPAKDTAQKAKPPRAKPAQKDTAKPAIKTVKDTGAQKPVPSKVTVDSTKAIKQPSKDTAAAPPVAKPKFDTSKTAPVPVKPKKDSAKTTAPAIDSTMKIAKTPSSDTAESAASAPSPKTAMKLRIKMQKDSSYVVVYRDVHQGVLWK